MLNAEYELLKKISASANHNRTFDPQAVPIDASNIQVYYQLIQQGYITETSTGTRLTPAAFEALRASQHLHEQRAYEEQQRMTDRAYADQQTEKQFHHDWRIAIFEVLVSFALGAIADYFFDIVGKCAHALSALLH